MQDLPDTNARGVWNADACPQREATVESVISRSFPFPSFIGVRRRTRDYLVCAEVPGVHRDELRMLRTPHAAPRAPQAPPALRRTPSAPGAPPGAPCNPGAPRAPPPRRAMVTESLDEFHKIIKFFKMLSEHPMRRRGKAPENALSNRLEEHEFGRWLASFGKFA